MRINQNIMAINARNNLSATESRQAKSLEKLSSGFRINRAGDDAAGLVISEGLRAQVGGLKMAVRNAQDGVSVVQTAEGALTEVHAMLQRMRDLTVQAGNTGANDENARSAIQAEIDQLALEIDRIGDQTKFGSVNLLDGTYGSKATQSGTANHTATAIAANSTFTIDFANDTTVDEVTVTLGAWDPADGVDALRQNLQSSLRTALTNAGYAGDKATIEVQEGATAGQVTVSIKSSQGFTTAEGTNNPLAALGITAGAVTASGSGGTFQIGANAGQTISLTIDDMRATALGVASLSVADDSAVSTTLTAIDAAIAKVSEQRGDLGATQNRLEHTIRNLSVTAENLTASESRIRDTDMAAEMMEFTRNQILSQAGTAMLAQANQVPQSVLSLLR